MTDTNKRLAIVTDARRAGVTRAIEQPATLGMAGRADPQRTTDFQAVLLAMATATIFDSHCRSSKALTNFSASASGPNPNNICCR